jgi:NADH:ubiquinone oxidoreductase subunit F (NADH-binding)/(2Fe-2S) ferredoxin/NAD-dependent dihydropyrimidine dehydrogenase PreA subunit
MTDTVTPSFLALRQRAADTLALRGHGGKIVVQVGSATCEHAAGSLEVAEEFARQIKSSGRGDVVIHRTGCTGRCSREPIVGIHVPGQRPVTYERVNREGVHTLFGSHIQGGQPVEALALDGTLATQVDPADARLGLREGSISQPFADQYGHVPFFSRQARVALRNCGVLDPESLEEYLGSGGFEALAAALGREPDWVIGEVLASQLRGRGGGGYLTGLKWRGATQQPGTTRYIICNGDEGDPGAFMDRGMLESDPFGVLEGMLLGAYAIQACRGFLYIRAEYPLAIRRIQNAIDRLRAEGLLGPDVLGSGWAFDLEIRLGAGAFVCGEETALIRSIEGERGQPRVRPPYPTERGLWGMPTVINNVETFANIAPIIRYGGEWFKGIGTAASGGTKVFALAGKVRHTGLVEVPLGTSLRDVVYGIGGGVADDLPLKAIQTGGPAGGFIPAKWADLEVDFAPLAEAGSIMGSGGMIVLSEEDCIVDIAKFYLGFTTEESCGKCTPCREGTTRMQEILERVTSGTAVMEDLDRLRRLARLCQRTSLCGLGRAAPNPILSSLQHFMDEYEEHILARRCRAKKCAALIRYVINQDLCIGCTVCARNCPVECISGKRKEAHVVDQDRCIKCGQCFQVCRFDAVERV